MDGSFAIRRNDSATGGRGEAASIRPPARKPGSCSPLVCDLAGTPLQAKAFAGIAESVDVGKFPLGSRWLSCHIENGLWHGAGDETKLERILEIFLAWAEGHDG